jgi:microcystin-dependent protein
MNNALFLSDDYIGMVLAWFGSAKSIPPGWLMCDGTKIPGKYDLLITLVGANVPDLGGRVIIGAGTPFNPLNTDNSNPNWYVTNPVFTNKTLMGEFMHYLSIGEIPSHNHNVPTGVPWQGGGGSYPDLMTEGSGPNCSPTDSQGGSGGHNNAQPAVVMNYIIYAGQSET